MIVSTKLFVLLTGSAATAGTVEMSVREMLAEYIPEILGATFHGHPGNKGDAIRWDKTSGTVEAIGLKTTRVRAVSGEEVIISNTKLLGQELHNMQRLRRPRSSWACRDGQASRR